MRIVVSKSKPTSGEGGRFVVVASFSRSAAAGVAGVDSDPAPLSMLASSVAIGLEGSAAVEACERDLTSAAAISASTCSLFEVISSSPSAPHLIAAPSQEWAGAANLRQVFFRSGFLRSRKLETDSFGAALVP
jgi:hypothetical protein